MQWRPLIRSIKLVPDRTAHSAKERNMAPEGQGFFEEREVTDGFDWRHHLANLEGSFQVLAVIENEDWWPESSGGH